MLLSAGADLKPSELRVAEREKQQPPPSFNPPLPCEPNAPTALGLDLDLDLDPSPPLFSLPPCFARPAL